MLYILDQRLRAQNETDDKIQKGKWVLVPHTQIPLSYQCYREKSPQIRWNSSFPSRASGKTCIIPPNLSFFHFSYLNPTPFGQLIVTHKITKKEGESVYLLGNFLLNQIAEAFFFWCVHLQQMCAGRQERFGKEIKITETKRNRQTVDIS